MDIQDTRAMGDGTSQRTVNVSTPAIRLLTLQA